MTRYAILPLLAGLLGAVPAPAQHGGTYYQAHTFQGRYYPSGYYTHTNGCYYHNGQQCSGYASAADYFATVKVQKVVVQDVPFYWSVTNPYPAAPAADPAKDKVLDALLLSQQQAAQYQQQQNLLLLQALLLRGKGDAPAAVDPSTLTVPPIPQAAPLRQPAPPKAGIEAFVGKYCLSCHGGNGAKGGLDLSDLGRLSRDQWEGVYDRMWCDKDMPPPDKPQPTDAELKAVRPEMRQRKQAAK